jgi:hypothetical protein
VRLAEWYSFAGVARPHTLQSKYGRVGILSSCNVSPAQVKVVQTFLHFPVPRNGLEEILQTLCTTNKYLLEAESNYFHSYQHRIIFSTEIETLYFCTHWPVSSNNFWDGQGMIRILEKIMVWKYEGKRRLGTPSCGWGDNIKMGLRMKVVDWIHVERGRNLRLDLVSKVVNTWIS